MSLLLSFGAGDRDNVFDRNIEDEFLIRRKVFAMMIVLFLRRVPRDAGWIS